MWLSPIPWTWRPMTARRGGCGGARGTAVAVAGRTGPAFVRGVQGNASLLSPGVWVCFCRQMSTARHGEGPYANMAEASGNHGVAAQLGTEVPETLRFTVRFTASTSISFELVKSPWHVNNHQDLLPGLQARPGLPRDVDSEALWKRSWLSSWLRSLVTTPSSPGETWSRSARKRVSCSARASDGLGVGDQVMRGHPFVIVPPR